MREIQPHIYTWLYDVAPRSFFSQKCFYPSLASNISTISLLYILVYKAKNNNINNEYNIATAPVLSQLHLLPHYHHFFVRSEFFSSNL